MTSYLFVALTILFTVYGQLVLKAQVIRIGGLEATPDKLQFLLKCLLNPWIASTYVAAFLASLSWMVAMTKLPLSYAYPFTSLAFVFVLVASAILFQETLSVPKLLGTGLIVAGIVVASQG